MTPYEAGRRDREAGLDHPQHGYEPGTVEYRQYVEGYLARPLSTDAQRFVEDWIRIKHARERKTA